MPQPIQDEMPKAAKGKRPFFFDDPAIDQLLSIVLQLAQEHSVLYDRLDTIERILDDKGALSRADLEDWTPSDVAEGERAARREAYLQRLFRVVRAEGQQFAPAAAKDMAEDLDRKSDAVGAPQG